MPHDIEPPLPSLSDEIQKFLTDITFDEFDLAETILQGIEAAGFKHCTPIQAQTLPITLQGKDVAGQAQTGTGKTAAFLIAIFAKLLKTAAPKKQLPSALIVAPTRELATQIYDEACVMGEFTGLRTINVIGGVDYTKQADQLRAGVDIVVCTPGRIIDYYKQKVFKTEGIEIVVIDEADRLLDLGFARDMRFILKKLPPYTERQSLLFSATLSHRVMELTYEYMNLPEFVDITPQEVTVEGIDQSLIHTGNDTKLSLLLGILEKDDWNRVIIFVNTKSGVEWLSEKLKKNKLPATGITGDLPQRRRFQLMKQFKQGAVKILVATDVASRGIHVEDISHVINYDIPQDAENYVHRIGRTARAGKKGVSISFACETYVFHLEALENMLGSPIPVVWPEDDWYKTDQAGPVKTRQMSRAKKPTNNRSKRGGRPVKKPVPKRNAKKPPYRSKGPDYFPGTFFGFMPPEPDSESDPIPATAPQASPRKPRPRKRRPSKANKAATPPTD